MLSGEICIIGSHWPNKLSYATEEKRNRSEKGSVRSGIDRRTFRLRVPDAYRCATIATVTPVRSSLNRRTRRFKSRTRHPPAWEKTSRKQKQVLWLDETSEYA